MGLSYHKNLVGLDHHPPGYVQAGDPGAIGVKKLWVDTSAGEDGYEEKIRNDTNSGWVTPAFSLLKYVQVSDPGAIGAKKLWVDISGGATSYQIKIRNVTNTDWLTLSGVSAGTLSIWAGESMSDVPDGFLWCSGSAVSRSVYANLFNAIGTDWGSGDGATTFNIPDLRGRFLRTKSAGTARDPDAATRSACNPGGNVGDHVGSVQGADVESHIHRTIPYPHDFWVLYSAAGTYMYHQPGSGITNGIINLVNSESYGGNETRPLNAYVEMLIKY